MNCDNQCCENKHEHYINDRYGINVTVMAHTQEPLVVEQAAELVPEDMRKPGTKITFWTFEGWQTWQFQSMDVRKWVLPESWLQDTDELKDIQNQIDSIQIGGWAISNQLGDDTHIGISQKALTDIIGYDNTPDTIRGRIKNIEDEIGTDTTSDSLSGRITSLETAVGSGGSVDSRIEEAEAQIVGDASSNYNTLGKIEDRLLAEISARTSADTSEATARANADSAEATARAAADSAEKTRAQNAEELLRQAYEALTQTDVVVGALPGSGTAGKIYRVPGTTSYSDYMWNGSSFVKMAEYDNATDDAPTASSNNLVKSGGVYSSINTLNSRGANALMGALAQSNKVTISDTRTTNYNLGANYTLLSGVTIPQGTRIGIDYTVNSGTVDDRILITLKRSDNTWYEPSAGTTEITTQATYYGIGFKVVSGGSATNGNISAYVYIDTSVSVLESDPHINYSNVAGKGSYGYIDSEGVIHSSTVTRYLIYHMYVGQMIRVRVNNATNVAVISTKVGDGDIVPRVMSHAYPNLTQSASYTPTEDCDVYVCYNTSLADGDCYVYIHGIQTIPSTRPNISVNFGRVPADYYRTHQTEISFPDKSQTTASQVYAAYDTLLNSQFTKQLIGTTSDRQPLYVYKFKPLRSNIYGSYAKKNPQILIICGQHGWEKASVMGTYTLIKDMFENHTTDPVLSYLHSHIELHIVPVANTYGFDNMTYVNANGVNLNRNWPVRNWTGGDGTGDQYGGLEPLDQPETFAINNYWEENLKDSCFIVIDFHTQSRYNVDTNANISWFSVIGYGYPYIQNLLNASIHTVETITEHFLVDYAEDIPEASACGHVSGAVAPNSTTGLAETYFTQVGNMGMTLESTDGLPQGDIDGKNVQTQASELLGNFLMNLFNEFGNQFRI